MEKNVVESPMIDNYIVQIILYVQDINSVVRRGCSTTVIARNRCPVAAGRQISANFSFDGYDRELTSNSPRLCSAVLNYHICTSDYLGKDNLFHKRHQDFYEISTKDICFIKFFT